MVFSRVARMLMAVALMAATNAFADPAADQVSRSNAATNLFMEFCIKSNGDYNQLRGIAAQYHLLLVSPEFAPRFLAGKTGRVWSATNSLGEFVIIGAEDNSCQIWARRADAETSIQHFNRIISGVARPGLVVRRYKDDPLETKDGTYRMIVYMMRREDQEVGMLASIIASQSSTAAVQVRLKLAPAADR